MDLVKLAAYLEDAHEDPLLAAGILKANGIYHVGLKYVWNTPIYEISDDNIARVNSTLQQNDIRPVIMYTELGMENSRDLESIKQADLVKAFNIAAYFKINIIRFGVGYREYQKYNVGYIDNVEAVTAWMKRVQSLAIEYGVVPVMDLYNSSYLAKPEDIHNFLEKFTKWKLLFDPAQPLIRSNVDIVDKYWHPLKKYVVALELHDFKTGYGHKPVGFGDAQVSSILKDCENESFDGWYILKPSLGRVYGECKTRSEVFSLAHQTLKSLLEAE
jgi:sugar phosphate isomerase/epimerase